MKKPLAVGVDLGGTWLRVVAIRSDGRVVRTQRAPSVPLARLPAHLKALWQHWKFSSKQISGLVLASRGVWTARERSRAATSLGGLARHVRAISDVEAAYRGALGARPGILLLAGTGSIALGRNQRGRWARRGGLGPLLGDEGSAFWIGRAYLRATTRGEDFSPARAIVTAPDAVAKIALLAPRVLRQASRGDRLARRTVAGAQQHLAELVITLARDLQLRAPIAVSWAGSLLMDRPFRVGVWHKVKRAGLVIKPVEPVEAPVHAAVHLALQLANSRGNRGVRVL